MSSSDLVREPAWSGLAPGLPRWKPADSTDADLLCAAAGIPGRLFSLRFGDAAPDMFRLEPNEGAPLFLKRIDPSRRAIAERAEAIAAWLEARGITVVAPLPGFPRPLPDGRTLVALPYLDGRRVEPSSNDLRALGSAVASLHAALAEHPDRPAWSRATADRLAALVATRADLLSGAISEGPDPQRLAALAADPDLDFVQADHEPRPLHGDLNPGNVLVVQDRPVLLDFEDVFHSVLPAGFELALAVERFVLVPVVQNEAAIVAGRAFLDGYRAGIRPKLARDPVSILRSLALRSLCVLTAGARAGTRVADAEWHKFFDLERQARTRAPTIRAIFEECGQWRFAC